MQKTNLFLTAIKNNADGCSINPSTLQPVNTQAGYFVSITDNEYKRANSRIVNTLKKQAKKLNLKDYFIGYWKDAKTGKHYIDLSLLIDNKDIALNIAKLFNQKAIFDNSTKESIYC